MRRHFRRFVYRPSHYVFIVLLPLLFTQCGDTDSSASDEDKTDVFLQTCERINSRIRASSASDRSRAITLLQRGFHIADSMHNPAAKALFAQSLGVLYFELDRFDSAQQYCDSAIHAATTSANDERIAGAYILRGILLNEHVKTDSALAAFRMAEQHIDPSCDTLLYTKLLSNRANTLSRRGNYAASIEANLEAAKLLEQMNMHATLAVIYDNIASDNSSLGENELAIRFYKRAISHNLKENDLQHLTTNFANLGVTYKLLGKLDSARECYFLSLSLAEQLDLPGSQAQNYHNLANSYRIDGDFNLAEQMYQRSIQISEDNGMQYGVLLNSMGLAGLRMLEGKYDEAEHLYRNVLPKLVAQGLLHEQSMAYKGLSRVQEKRGQYASALRWQKKFHALNDSLQKASAGSKIRELQSISIAAEREAENAELRSELTLHQMTIARQRTLVIGISIFTIAALAFIGFLVAARRRRMSALAMLEEQKRITEQKSEQLTQSNAIKELLLDIITHDLSNPAGTIRNAATLLKDEKQQDELLDIVYRSSGRLIDIIENARTLSHATVFDSIPHETLFVKALVERAYEEYEAQLKRAGMECEIDIDPRLTVEANPVIVEVIKNYLSNAIRHASEGRRVVIDAVRHATGVDISVADFGKTIPDADRDLIFKRSIQRAHAATHGHGLGLAIAERIAHAHGGEVWAEPNEPHGNRFVLRLPFNGKAFR
ncbi:tetratricopeptide repeat-containing sensor histidine kinase [bacterium]|nr:tetratricopeptide repeat-containing sensor histidine kinase [bacterium]